METIERIPLERLHFLNEMDFKTFKANQYHSDKCKNDGERKVQFQNIKSFCQGMIKARGEMKRFYSYSLTTPLSSQGGGRLYCSNSVQSLPKKIRGFLLQGITTDIDQKNSAPKIMRYICSKNNYECPNLDYYIKNTDMLRSKYDKMAFINAITDCKPVKNASGFLKDYDVEIKRLVKQIVSLEQYKLQTESVPDVKKYNREGSAISRILGFYENEILQVVLNLLNRKQIELMAPMFDGCMPYGNYYNNKELLNEITFEVEEHFNGLNMVWAYKEHDSTIVMPDDYKIPELKERAINKDMNFCCNELEATDLLYKLLKNSIKYSEGKLYYKHNHIWRSDEKEIESLLINYVMNSKIYKTNEKDEINDFVQNRKTACNVAKNIVDKAIVYKDNGWFNSSVKSSLGKILFNNGYYDFRTEIFYRFEDEGFNHNIVFFETIPYNFDALSSQELELVEEIKNKLFYTPFGKEIGDYYILQIARGLAGDEMKKCLFGIGSGNTGKSMMTSAIKSACGGYYGAFNAVNIAYNKSSSDEAQKLRWLMLLKTKRIIISNEIQSNVEIDGNMIKKISNGGLDDLIARGHGGNETSFAVSFLPILFANDLDKIKPIDDAVINRVRGINYTKVCVDKPNEELNEFEMKIDYGLKDTIETLEFKRAFMSVLIQAYMKFQEDGRVEIEPIELKKATASAIGNLQTIIEDFVMDFEITDNENDYMESSVIEQWLKGKNISMTKFGNEMNKFAILNNKVNVYSKVKKVNGKTKRVWVGLSETIEIEE